MGIWKSFAGTVRVELTTADRVQALAGIQKAGIPIFWVEETGVLTMEAEIYRRDYKVLKQQAERQGGSLRLISRRGLYWYLRQAVRRPVLALGGVLLLLLALYLPSRIFFVRIEGNASVPTRLILARAAECGISFGASRREVRSEKMKNALLGAIPELQWAGVNTAGCVATISVQERTAPKEQPKAAGVGSIVALRDGVIQSCTVTRGNALCRVGQAVKAGETLVSGYTDCGISIRADRAEAEIFALTQRELTVVTPGEMAFRGESCRTEKKFSLIIGKKRINFYKDSGILDSSCVKMYVEDYVELPGGFFLPLAIRREQWIYYDRQTAELGEAEAERILSVFSDRYLQDLMIAGRVLERECLVSERQPVYCLEGKYACLEMIGQERSEEIIKGNGKSD